MTARPTSIPTECGINAALDHREVLALSPDGWKLTAFRDFETTMMDTTRPFPCSFGVAGFKARQLRYLFCEDESATTLGEVLACYIAEARTFGPNTSLVAFFPPGPILTIAEYERKFWEILDSLARTDACAWPDTIPQAIDAENWEFCFAGEPVFVVGTSPAHVKRHSRRSSGFMMTFQPRWVFDKLLGTEAAAAAVFEKIRRRLVPYDDIAISPFLGPYGSPTNREFRQYFLTDDNDTMVCPFAGRLGAVPAGEEKSE